MGLLLKIVIAAAALWAAVQVVPGLDFEGSVVTLLIVALVLGVINAIVKPIITVLSLPLVILTLGLFLLVVNAIALWIVVAVSRAFELGLTSDGFGSTFLGALVVALVTWGLETVTGVRD
ncbi:MAG: phage holin family protein [Nitriliruptor sp.]